LVVPTMGEDGRTPTSIPPEKTERVRRVRGLLGKVLPQRGTEE
jgi:hypothetical protein